MRDETSDQTEAILNGLKRHAPRRIRRSGQGAAGNAGTVTIDGEQLRIPPCPHVETVTVRVPHPRYGDKVPHFETYTRKPGPHECVSIR